MKVVKRYDQYRNEQLYELYEVDVEPANLSPLQEEEIIGQLRVSDKFKQMTKAYNKQSFIKALKDNNLTIWDMPSNDMW